MHEVSIAESIVDIARDYAGRENVPLFSAIELQIGTLSGIEIEALMFAMDVVCRGTVLEGAEIRIQSVAGRARCEGCNFEFPVEDQFSPCPACGELRSSIISGEELRVSSLLFSE
ncbi:MAG: hydrogenase maturation nickel metallochaperone HypA [Bacteroidia bacterium]|nr:hydrogenase maturation nickel metallochaperone HypA [Bacteroidia bacterium]